MKRDEKSREIIDILTRAGARIAAPSKRLVDEVMHAARNGDVSFLGLAKEAGMRPGEIVDPDGRNVLHYVRKGRLRSTNDVARSSV